MTLQDEMNEIVVCKYCGRLEYYGKMMWQSGKCSCRDCYKADYETNTGKLYTWNDLDGVRPTEADYIAQEEMKIN